MLARGQSAVPQHLDAQRRPAQPAQGITRLIFEWLFPARCPGCGAIGSSFCQACQGSFSPGSIRLDGLRVRSLGFYQGPLKKAVLGLKSAGQRSLLPALAEALAGQIEGPWVLVGVPAVASRKRYRGFEPAVELARALARQTGLEHRQSLVCVVEPGEQKFLSAQQREANLSGVFQAVGAVPERVLLVDDVVTTGATLRACARVLGQAAALEGLCLARVPRRSPEA